VTLAPLNINWPRTRSNWSSRCGGGRVDLSSDRAAIRLCQSTGSEAASAVTEPEAPLQASPARSRGSRAAAHRHRRRPTEVSMAGRGPGFEGAVDYKAPDRREHLKAQASNGIDVFFDNVGGEALRLRWRGWRAGRRRALRRCLAVQRRHRDAPAGQLRAAACRARIDDRLCDLRLRPPLRGRCCTAGEVATQRRIALAGADHPRRRQ
jgi:hypothetical protein